jgi:hypothetical protein
MGQQFASSELAGTHLCSSASIFCFKPLTLVSLLCMTIPTTIINVDIRSRGALKCTTFKPLVFVFIKQLSVFGVFVMLCVLHARKHLFISIHYNSIDFYRKIEKLITLSNSDYPLNRSLLIMFIHYPIIIYIWQD